jgi:hypothetical protein
MLFKFTLLFKNVLFEFAIKTEKYINWILIAENEINFAKEVKLNLK